MAEELLLTSYERAWNLRDQRACAECFASHGVREFRVRQICDAPVDSPRLIQGRQAIAADIREVMVAVPDLSVEIVSVGYGSDRRLWTEWRLRGTSALGGRAWPPTGQRIEVLGVSIFRLSNAGFLEERLYWDSAFTRGRRDGLPGLHP